MKALQILILELAVVLLIDCCASRGIAWSQWKPAYGIGGDYVDCFAEQNNVLLAGTSSGLIRSTDSGATWSEVEGPFQNYDIQSLLWNDSLLLVGTDSGLYRSTDTGNTWQVPSGIDHLSIHCFLSIGSFIFAGTESEGIFKSSDVGATWLHSNDTFQSTRVASLMRDGGTLYAASLLGVLQSNDSGTSWISLDSGLAGSDFRALEINNGFLFAASKNNGIFRRNISDSRWEQVNAGLQDSFTVALYSVGHLVFAGSASGIYRSSDNGSAWVKVADNLPQFTLAMSYFLNGKFFYAGTGDGIFRSTDSGLTWNSENSSMRKGGLVGMIMQGPYLYAANADNHIFRSSDAGVTWVSSCYGYNTNPDAFDNDVPTAMGVFGSYLFAGVDTNLYRSNDSGTQWIRCSKNFYVNSIANTDSDLYTACYNVERSSNEGRSWINIGNDDGGPMSVTTIDNSILTVDPFGFIKRSTDRGITWGTVYNGDPEVISSTLVAGQGSLYACTLSDLISSTDDGISWRHITALPDSFAGPSAFLGSASTNIFVGWGNKIYLSRDSGAEWSDVSDGITGTIDALFCDGNDLYAMGTENFVNSLGLWRRSLSEMIPQPQPAIDTASYNLGDTISVSLTDVPSHESEHRITIRNKSGAPVLIKKILLTQINSHLSFSQLLPSTPDTVPNEGSSSVIVHFRGDSQGSIYRDTLRLITNDRMIAFEAYIDGHSFDNSEVNNRTSTVQNNLIVAPNPLAQETRVTLVLETTDFTDISIVNQLGIEVAHLFAGELAAGEHEFHWVPTALPDGMYECLVRMDGRVQTVPILLQH